jgi:lantibiotic biosynthesis protein
MRTSGETYHIVQNTALKYKLAELISDLADFDYTTTRIGDNAGMFSGTAGLSLFYYHAYLFTSNERYLELSMQYFQNSFTALSHDNFGLSHGATGTMWLMNFFKKEQIVEMPFEEYLEAYDEVLYKRIDQYSDNIDPMHGLLSLANYFLERNNATAAKALVKIAGILDESKVPVENGIAWELSKHDPGAGTYRHINLGYAHGVPAVLYFLSRFIQAKIEETRCRQLLDQGLHFLLSLQDFTQENYFPGRIVGNEIRICKKLAYCYSDLGIACGLTAIARNLDDAALLATAKNAACHVAGVSLNRISYFPDIGLCHGAAGNGYMFHKLFQVHQAEILREASENQFQKLMALRNMSMGITGFTAIDFDKVQDKFIRKTDAGFIEGTSGMGLAIIGYLKNDLQTNWDRILFLS